MDNRMNTRWSSRAGKTNNSGKTKLKEEKEWKWKWKRNGTKTPFECMERLYPRHFHRHYSRT